MLRLDALRRKAQIAVLRALPLSSRWKQRLVWALLPHFTIGVAAVVRDPDGRVLILRSAWHGGWGLPGGAVEHGERFDDAMRREALEELGLALIALERVALLHDSAGRGLLLLYRGSLGAGAIRLSEEHTAWEYRAIADLPPGPRVAAQRALGVSRAEPGRGAAPR